MGVPAVVVAEVTKCGNQLLTRMVENITQFNIEKVNLKSTVVKSIAGMVTVYEDSNKTYIESSEKALEKILKRIPANADPNQVVELLMQSQKDHNMVLKTGMLCGTIFSSIVVCSVSLVLGASARKPIIINNNFGINLIKK